MAPNSSLPILISDRPAKFSDCAIGNGIETQQPSLHPEVGLEHRPIQAPHNFKASLFPIAIPSLTDRPEDIPLLANYFVQGFRRKIAKNIFRIDRTFMKALMSYRRPGNIRELERNRARRLNLRRPNSPDPSTRDRSVSPAAATPFTNALLTPM